MEFTRKNLTIDPHFDIEEWEPYTVIAQVRTSCALFSKLNLDFSVPDGSIIRLYAYYDTEQDWLSMMYTITAEGIVDGDDYEPTDNERDLIVKMMEECCMENYKCTLTEFCKRNNDF